VSVSKLAIKKMRIASRHPKRREKGQVRADINVTPLVDVVLVLLIIFMVVTPMIVSGVQVDLPKTAHHDKKPDDGKDIIISVTHTKEIYMMAHKIELKDLDRKVDEEMRRNPGKTIFVKADNRLTYGAAREVMEKLNKAGIEDIMLGVDEIAQGGTEKVK
jgi:biopolymer transport protein TolR